MFIAPHFASYYRDLTVAELAREPFEWIEYDQTFCGNVYGDANCGAILDATAGQKCFNTIGTCQRIENFAPSVLTLRFCRNVQNLPRDGGLWFPFLRSVRITSSTINPGGGNRSASALGTRAKISATLTDHPSSDRAVDPYADERLSGAAIFGGVGYDPLTRSTFWRKWSARNPYKLNRALRHCSGYIDERGNLYDVVRRSFVVTGFSGPTRQGTVVFDGQDILANVHNDKAQAPLPSTGKLAASITAGDLTATLTPAGVGNSEYPESGWARIGDEVVSFVRAGDVLTIARAQYGTAAAAHNANETVQLCLRFYAQTPAAIIRTLLVDYGRIPADAIDAGQWAAETSAYLPRLYSTLIAEPTGVKQLLSEISEQLYCFVFFDERAGLVRLRAVRAPTDDATIPLDEDAILADSVAITEQGDQQITRVVVNYGVRDYTQGLDELTNYRATDVFGDFTEELPERGNGARIKTIFSRWLEVTDGAAASELGARLLARYKSPPRRVAFALDAKDRGIWVGDFVRVTTRQAVNKYGDPEPIAAQVVEVNETEPGSEFTYAAQSYAADPPAVGKSVEIAADVLNINLRDLYDAKYGTAPGAERVTFIVRPGVVVGSASIASPAVALGSWPGATTVWLQNNGYIVGKGGDGADTNGVWPGGFQVGQNGGDAIDCTAGPLTLENLGVVGGGGGGSGAWAVFPGPSTNVAGSGGCGRNVGIGGTATGSTNNVQGIDGVLDWGAYPGGLGLGGQDFSAWNGPNLYGTAGGIAGRAVRTIGTNLTLAAFGDVRGIFFPFP